MAKNTKTIVKVTIDEPIYHLASSDEIECPQCGQEPYGVEQTFVAPSRLLVDDTTGALYYDGGTDTEILWNNSEDIRVDGKLVLVCREGHLFTHPGVTSIPLA